MPGKVLHMMPFSMHHGISRGPYSCGLRCLLPAGQLHARVPHPTQKHRLNSHVSSHRHIKSDGRSLAAAELTVQPLTSSTTTPTDLTAVAADALLHGNGLAKAILSDPDIEGNPLAFLKATEAYWKEMRNRKHEPSKKGPSVITTSTESFTAHISNSEMQRPHSFGAAPTSAAHADSSSSAVQQQHDYDVIMCGGTLGICVALALQQQGYRVAVVEKRRVEGRVQEWNSSRHECQVLVDMGLITQSELDAAIVSEFNPIRVGFKGGEPLWVTDCLNVGVSPKTLIHSLRLKFEALGGVIYEQTEFRKAVTCPDGLVVTLAAAADAPVDVGDTNRPNALGKQQRNAHDLQLSWQQQQQQQQHRNGKHSSKSNTSGNGGSVQMPFASSSNSSGSSRTGCAPSKLSCRLLLDCMGHYSPIVKQLRGKTKPDGMVLVVGGCATGFPAELNTTADLLTTITDASADMQLFWEAFPAEGGAARTTYMFAYSDAHPSRPSFEKLLDAYFALMPAYQGLKGGLQGVKFKRVLFGGFPCYSDAPLKPGFDRVLQLGDASASQSPLSFGGFGCMLRHLSRLSTSISHALKDDKLSRSDLSWIHPYQPSLSAAMLFQRSMSMGVGQLAQQQQQPSVSNGSSSNGNGTVPGNGSAVHHSSSTGNGNSSSNNAYAISRATDAHTSNGSSNASSSSSSSPQWTVINSTAASSNSADHAPTNTTTSSSSSSSDTAQPSWLRKLLLLPANHINALLGANFTVMLLLGQRVLKPFLQDTLQLGPLAVTMLGMMLVKPLVISRVLLQVGAKVVLGWFGHFAMLAAYTLGHILLSPLRRFTSNYTFHRFLDALQYGSSNDYAYAASAAVSKAQVEQLNAMWAAATAAAGPATTAPPPGKDPAQVVKSNNIVPAQIHKSQQQLRQRVKVSTVPGRANGWQSSEMVSHHGQQLRYVVAGGEATQSMQEEAMGAPQLQRE